MMFNARNHVLYWDSIVNFGDMLNVPLCKEIFGVDIIKTSPPPISL